MSSKPVVTGQSPQPTTGSQLINPERPTYGGQYIQFAGSLTNGVNAVTYSFAALAGDGAPTVTGGFAKWNVIDRPQRVGMTVLAGYDPITMDVPILFDAVARKGAHVEQDIEILEWMGGRGRLYASSSVGHAGQGDSPILSVFSTNTGGDPVPLVPFQYQSADIKWVIATGGISYDPNPLRGKGGHRIRQKATVTLLQHVDAPGNSLDSSAVRQRGRQQQAGRYKLVAITAHHNTIRKIAAFDAHNPTHAAAVAILDANRDDKKLRLGRSVDADLTKHLPLGTRIKVPLSVIR